MSSFWGNNIHIQIFGESHGTAIGAVADGFPEGIPVDLNALRNFMLRRAPGMSNTATQRKEDDNVEILSGVFNGVTTGSPIAITICNSNAHSNDYDSLHYIPRPGHADFTAQAKFNGFQDYRGGGHFSGRLTAPLCAIGAIAMQILAKRGIVIGAHIASIGDVCDASFDYVSPSSDALLAPGKADFPVIDNNAGNQMKEAILQAKSEGDSLGGCIEAVAIGIPAGLGNPIFDGIENRLASIMFGIPAVRGIEFGTGMNAAKMKGSEHNDAFIMDNGKIRTATNNHGGILGGITTGMPIVLKVAIKPTPSIAKPQQSINMQTGEAVSISVNGRHDPCIVPRAVPVVEAAMAIALLDIIS